MADLYVGLSIGQIDSMGDQLTIGTTHSGAVDVEVFVKNGTTAGSSPMVIDVNKILEMITFYFINHGVDVNATPTSLDL